MLIQLPGGSALDSQGSAVAAEDNGEIHLHTPTALSRLIERWRADTHPNLAGMLTSFTDRVQELENVIWDVIVGRLPDYAVGEQLDMLGRTVGQRREGLGDAAYRAHIKARIRINQSFGTATDVIEMLRLVDTAPFHLRENGTARFFIWYDEPPSNASIGRELAGLVRQARAAGVGALVTIPADTDTAFYGAGSYDPLLNAARGYSSGYDPSVGGKYGFTARA